MSSLQTKDDTTPDEPVPNPKEQKSRVFSNSNRNRKPKQQTNANKPKVSAGPKGAPPAGPPKPQHLSGKGTSLANDPLWQEAFVLEGDKGYVQVPKERKFQVTTEGFHDIVAAVYTEMSMVDGHFRKTIPESAFHYHAIMLLHARLAELGKRHPETSTYEDFRFVELMKENWTGPRTDRSVPPLNRGSSGRGRSRVQTEAPSKAQPRSPWTKHRLLHTCKR